jgi:hypothetical protein
MVAEKDLAACTISAINHRPIIGWWQVVRVGFWCTGVDDIVRRPIYVYVSSATQDCDRLRAIVSLTCIIIGHPGTDNRTGITAAKVIIYRHRWAGGLWVSISMDHSITIDRQI